MNGLSFIIFLWTNVIVIVLAKDKYMKIENIYQCANSEEDPVKIWHAEGNTKFLKNRARFNASFAVSKKVTGDLQVKMTKFLDTVPS